VTLSSGLAGESITAGNDAALIVESFLKHAVKGICKGAFLAYSQLLCWHLPGDSGDDHCPDRDLNWVNPEFVSSVMSSTKLVGIPLKK
jgi:hypothetical protein